MCLACHSIFTLIYKNKVRGGGLKNNRHIKPRFGIITNYQLAITNYQLLLLLAVLHPVFDSLPALLHQLSQTAALFGREHFSHGDRTFKFYLC
jgi:hypothetical protein